MTEQQPHTPSATQIREDYAHLRYHFADGWSIGEERVQFDNWLTAEVAAAEQRGAAPLLKLLQELVDPDDCWFDHHGGCQAHGYLWLEPGETCPHQDAKELIRADQMEADDETH